MLIKKSMLGLIHTSLALRLDDLFYEVAPKDTVVLEGKGNQ